MSHEPGTPVVNVLSECSQVANFSFANTCFADWFIALFSICLINLIANLTAFRNDVFRLKRTRYQTGFMRLTNKYLEITIAILIVKTYLGLSISGTWRKFELFGFCGLSNVGAGLASNSATGTCGLPKPAWIPYNISWNTLHKNKYLWINSTHQCSTLTFKLNKFSIFN